MKPELLEFWIDLNLPPVLAEWLRNEFKVQAKSFEELNLITTSDIDVLNLQKQDQTQ